MLMAPADFGRDIDRYQNWLCDVTANYTGGGGGGWGGYVIGADQDYVGTVLYESNVKFYGYSTFKDYSKVGDENVRISNYDGHIASPEEYYANKIAPDLAGFAQAYVDRKVAELQSFINTLNESINIESPLIAGIGMGAYNPIFCSPCFQFKVEFSLAMGDFYRNYMDMRNANWIGADKYFHCKANFQAASRGPGGVFFATHFGNLREIWDQRIKGYPRWDSIADQEANKWGRDQVGIVLEPCIACGKFRPIGLPLQY
jgi:hypothetical protein